MSAIAKKRFSAGFTLFELVVTMLIIGVLAAIGTPTFKYVTASNRVATEINGLLGDLQFARTEAVKEGFPVTVCSSTAPYTQCTASPGGSAWQNGWIVFLDTNNNHHVDAGEAVLRVQAQFNGADTLVSSDGAFSSITYNRLGYGITGSATGLTINLHDSSNNHNWTRCLSLTPIGAAVTEKYSVATAGAPACS
jgi:type IV fimbrial biogenesis protein FimT